MLGVVLGLTIMAVIGDITGGTMLVITMVTCGMILGSTPTSMTTILVGITLTTIMVIILIGVIMVGVVELLRHTPIIVLQRMPLLAVIRKLVVLPVVVMYALRALRVQVLPLVALVQTAHVASIMAQSVTHRYVLSPETLARCAHQAAVG